MKDTSIVSKKKSNHGFSLLELLLVLGIIAALIVAAFIVYPKVQASQRAQAESNNIATIQTAVKELYASASSFTGLDNTVAVRAKIFLDNMLSGSGTSATPINVFKGKVTVGSSNWGPSETAGSSFTIIYESVPAAECIKIIAAVGGNFYTVGVGSTGNVKAAGEVLNISKAVEKCKTIVTGSTFSLVFISI
ncbi:TPA: type 4 pilus major pilin [Pluralibacter gergoviae]